MECCICLDDKPRHEFSISGKCSHIFCTECITTQIRDMRKHDCPTCRARLELTDLVPIAEADKAIEEGEAVDLDENTGKEGAEVKKSNPMDEQLDPEEEKKF